MSDTPHPLVTKLRARLGDRVTEELAEVVEGLTNEEQAILEIMADNMADTDFVVLDPSSAHQLLFDVLVDLQTLDNAAGRAAAAPTKCTASGKLFPSGMLWLAAEQGAPREYWCPQCHAQWPHLHEDISLREGCAVVPDHQPMPMTEAYALGQLEMRAQWYRSRGAAVPQFLLDKERLAGREPVMRITGVYVAAGDSVPRPTSLRVDPVQLVTIGSGICQDCGVKQPLTPKGWIPLHTISGERCGGSLRKPLDHGRRCTMCRCYSCNLEVPLTLNGRAGLHFRDTTDAESGITTHEQCPGSLCHPRPVTGQ